MDVFPIATQWFFTGLAVGFVLYGAIRISISWGLGGKQWQGD
jgi:hypothetical protein